MKKVNTKKMVFWATLTALGSMIVVDMIGGSKICGVGNLVCRENLEDAFVLLYSIPVLFLLSLITYKMRDEVFHAWWNFARWWVPVIIVATLLLNSASDGGGGMGGGGLASGMLDFAVLWILYIILVIVSLAKIVRAYSKK
jgi:hypothetical protein